MATRHLRFFPEQTAARLASIFGPQSASAMALEELRLRRKRGETVALFEDVDDHNCLVVGPVPAELIKDEA